jgi:hypothetical protein
MFIPNHTKPEALCEKAVLCCKVSPLVGIVAVAYTLTTPARTLRLDIIAQVRILSMAVAFIASTSAV